MINKNEKISRPVFIRLVGLATAVLGFAGIFTVKTVFDLSIKNFISEKNYSPVAKDNYYLFFDATTLICAVLLALTLISVTTYIFQKEKATRFTVFTVTSAPVLCTVALIMVSCFYSYLTHGEEYLLWPYIILTGLFEVLLFALPLSFTKAHMLKSGKTDKTKRKKKSKN